MQRGEPTFPRFGFSKFRTLAGNRSWPRWRRRASAARYLPQNTLLSARTGNRNPRRRVAIQRLWSALSAPPQVRMGVLRERMEQDRSNATARGDAESEGRRRRSSALASKPRKV